MRTIGIVTVGRSDYGIYKPVLRAMASTKDLDARLMAAGAHFSERFGRTVGEIEADGFPIAERVEIYPADDSPASIATAMGNLFLAFAEIFARRPPDLLLALGDRFEMHAAVSASIPYGIPVAHIHGGEVAAGSMDERMRHSISKLAHLHFVAADEYGRRLVRMGEEPWRVVVSGAPALDNIRGTRLLDAPGLEKALGFPVRPAPLLVTFHPPTLELADLPAQIGELLAAVETSRMPAVFTYPNADMGCMAIIDALERFVASHPDCLLLKNMGARLYYSLMNRAAAMLGNSSSGIIEAASFGLPVVNVGDRQTGRMRGGNVIDVPCKRDSIAEALARAVSPAFRESVRGMKNPYGDGHAAARIVETLSRVPIGRELLLKKFHPDLAAPSRRRARRSAAR